MSNNVTDQMARAVLDGVFPGAVLLYGTQDKVLFEKAFGATGTQAPEPITTQTVFDLASLTKALATAPACMVLAGQDPGFLSRKLKDVLPGFSGSDKQDITVAQLLSHTAGFKDWRPYYEDLAKLPLGLRKSRHLEIMRNEPLAYAPGKGSLYSDLGYMVLQHVVEKTAHMTLDVFVREKIYQPLETDDLFYLPFDGVQASGPASLPLGRRFAATELCPWRGRILLGEVHDENAAALGGVGGHAGLFGTARGVWRIVAEIVGVYTGQISSKVFQGGVVKEFLTRGRHPGNFVLGFDTPTRPQSSSGAFFSDASIGHLGFTGTSFWADLEKEIIVVLLTNRVHPNRRNEKIKAFRPKIHDTVMQALGWC